MKKRNMSKRAIAILLLVCVFLSSLAIQSLAVSTVKLTGVTYPTEHLQGSPFVAKGIISSDYNILKVVIGVYNKDGSKGFEYTGLPGEKTYDISKVDYLLSFSKLSVGSYTYKIVASDEKSENVVLLNKSFNVVAESDQSTLSIKNANYPTSLNVGQGFSVKGTISSSYNITKVVFTALRSDGTKGFEYTVQPNAKSYDIANADYSLTFSKLSAGSYIYKITASDTKKANVVLLEKPFTVGSSSAGESTLKITNANYPTVLNVGQGFSVNGTISSSNNITKIVFTALRSDGTKGFEYTAQPGTKSYDIANIDYLLTFSKLSAGSYTYKIVASDTKQSNVTLLSKDFTVKAPVNANAELTKVNWNVADISYWNDIASWSQIASSLDAVILRVGFAYVSSKKMEQDLTFVSHYNEAKKRNLPVGCYYYSAATTVNEALAEADFVLNILKKNNCRFEMPVYYDMETVPQTNLTQAQCTEVARAFCDKLASEGYYVGIYCNKYFARDELYASKLSDYQFWIAEYNSSCTYNGVYGMWQYTETGRVSGINGNCDKNYCYYDYPSYIKRNGLNGFTAVSDPQFKLITGANLTVDESKKLIYLKNEGELSQDSFLSKYVQSRDVSIQFSGLVNGKIATACTVTAKSSSKSFGPYTICVMGDVNSDSKINSSDALAILQHSVGLQSLKNHCLTAADMNSDKAVDSADALAVLTYSVSGK